MTDYSVVDSGKRQVKIIKTVQQEQTLTPEQLEQQISLIDKEITQLTKRINELGNYKTGLQQDLTEINNALSSSV